MLRFLITLALQAYARLSCFVMIAVVCKVNITLFVIFVIVFIVDNVDRC
jgi:hypothetical protein